MAQRTDQHDLTGKRILVGVSGGIACYKTAMLVSRLTQAGVEVTVLMTESATRFVTPLTFQSLSGRPVYSSPWQHIESHDPQHISLANRADLMVIAPCTMDTMAKLAHGRADDVVSLTVAAIDRSQTPILLAPAMNTAMWEQVSNQRNLEQLVNDGFQTIGPETGWQACKTKGLGRMTEPDAIFDRIAELLPISRDT